MSEETLPALSAATTTGCCAALCCAVRPLLLSEEAFINFFASGTDSASGICTADELLSLADASGFVGKSQDETKNGAGGPMTSSLYLNWRRLDGRQKASACLTLHTPGKGNPKVSGICLIRSSASQPGFQNVISSASQSC
ncbi:hypothetical protein C0Q70_01823 [Pomacea canaliculata]|uniref:Uncharacterized protein n=1 Tax=Pomacea canaliculata TaxID=400727 RepID=A0A2T7Q0J1_POMCA|nr:hypothetical protein C0Q70_01823 [Pomacea canaliculata]